MAGTDRRRALETAAGGPAVILIDPQLGENIGMVARAMLNCGLVDLRLVRPRDGWPSDKAISAASGADGVLERAQLFDRTEDAIADLGRVFAATARPRDMTKVVYTPSGVADAMRQSSDIPTGILFGGEAKGLKNDDIALADAIITAPLNPGFTSLNLAQAVLVVAYAWYQADDATPDSEMVLPATRPATKDELVGLFEHLESALDDSGFFHVQERRPILARNLRNMLQRANLTEQEIRTLRGVVASFQRGRREDDPAG